MFIKNNFQRNLIMFALEIFNTIILSILFFILFFIYKIPIYIILIVVSLFCIYYNTEPFETSKKIYKKYCNKECHNCSMWHCDFHYKDGKYVK